MTKTFTAQQIQLNLVQLLQQPNDPSAGGGTSAAIGSMVLRSGTGQLWLKTAAPDTGWQKLVQSFNWYVVLDYGAAGTGLVDDTVPVQAAIDACNLAGGGVVYFPPGVYAVTQLTMTGTANVQLMGAGTSSTIKWVWNAASAAGAMITVSANASKSRFSQLQFDGSGLTNPDPGRTNHLLAIGHGTGAITTHVMQCQFIGMVANAGDGVHVLGGAGTPVSRFWVVDCNFDGCSRYSVGVEQGFEYGWIVDNYMTNCDTEIAVVASASLLSNALTIHGNKLVHTSASVRHTLLLEGDATIPITRLVVAQNTCINGFCAFTNIQWASFMGNIHTSGAYASTDPVWRIFGAVTFTTFAGGNVVIRSPGASDGACILAQKVTNSPTMVRIGQNVLINEGANVGPFVKIVDCTQMSIGGNVCHSTNAGTSTAYGIEVQAVTMDLTDMLLGPGNQFTTDAGSLAAAVRLLANGANITDCSVVGNQGDLCDYGLWREIGGGGGTFNGQLLYTGNNFDSTVGDVHDVGVTGAVRVGFNASAFGANLFSGSGSPEGAVTARIGSQYLRSDGGQGTVLYYKESGTGNTGWVAIGGAPIVFGADDLGTAATALFFAPGYTPAATATEIKFTITRPGTLRNLRVQVATAGTDAQTVTYTVRKNGVDTLLLCSENNNAAGAASDLVDKVAVVAGDLVSISIVKGGVVTAGQKGVTASVEFI